MDFGEVGFAALSLAMALNLPPLAVSIPIVNVASKNTYNNKDTYANYYYAYKPKERRKRRCYYCFSGKWHISTWSYYNSIYKWIWGR